MGAELWRSELIKTAVWTVIIFERVSGLDSTLSEGAGRTPQNVFGASHVETAVQTVVQYCGRDGRPDDRSDHVHCSQYCTIQI